MPKHCSASHPSCTCNSGSNGLVRSAMTTRCASTPTRWGWSSHRSTKTSGTSRSRRCSLPSRSSPARILADRSSWWNTPVTGLIVEPTAGRARPARWTHCGKTDAWRGVGRGSESTHRAPGHHLGQRGPHADRMRLNWFSPLPPAETDVAHYTARLLPYLGGSTPISRCGRCSTSRIRSAAHACGAPLRSRRHAAGPTSTAPT